MNKVPQIVTLAVSLFGVIGLPNLAANWVHAHFVFYLAFVCAAIVLHALFPSIFAAPSNADKEATGFGDKPIAAVLFMLAIGSMALTVPARAQAPVTPVAAPLSNIYAAGVSYNGNGSPAVAGTALYAHALNASGTYAFTLFDALPAGVKPFAVNTNIGAGIAQKVFTVAGHDIYVPSSAGISWNGPNVGWQWNTGATALFKLKGNWYVMPTVRVLKSSVSGGTGYQPVLGVLFAWGQ